MGVINIGDNFIGMAQKKASDIGISESELGTLKAISENLQVKGKSLGEVKAELEDLIVDDEKDSIYVISWDISIGKSWV